ncbi:histidine kinase [Amycolatopsis acidicola]|uniref:histidine kinase n=1 Tax=Amycolatopsis acidicola TaxID=2596893 RepID=A0A5N0UIL9_9PSEU|nr:histidine kinase [Amycolatopsis acidicola]KAA9148578.1 histidine kinase [Amycolatopsis acidicola]
MAIAVLACLGLPGVGVLPVLSAVTVVCGATTSALCWPRRSVPLALCASGAALMSLLSTAIDSGDTPDALSGWLLVETAFLLVLLAQVARRAPVHLDRLVAALVFSAVLVAPIRVGPWSESPPPVAEFLKLSCCWGFLGACAVAVGLYLRLLDEARARSIRSARQAQRTELAREVHDWLAHELTGIVLEAQAAELAVRNTESTRLALRRIEESGVRALSSMDRAIGLLRAAHDGSRQAADELPHSPADLREMVDRFASGNRARVCLVVEEGLGDLAPETASVVHRVVLESLTNVRRHSPSSGAVDISLRRRGCELSVEIVNDAPCRQGLKLHGARRGGRGLEALADQVRALDGEFEAGPNEPGGWRVRATLPVASG